jgi:hypothetical protein
MMGESLFVVRDSCLYSRHALQRIAEFGGF